jgi:hypothetical protein
VDVWPSGGVVLGNNYLGMSHEGLFMKVISNHMLVFLKSSVQKIQGKREHWNAILQESLQELDDPKYEKTGQTLVFVFLRFFLLLLRLVTGVFLFLLSTIFFRGTLESIQYLPLCVLFFFFSFVCLVSPFMGSAFKLWRDYFLTLQFKSFTLKLFLQLAFLCMAFHTAWHVVRIVWDFFVKGIGG